MTRTISPETREAIIGALTTIGDIKRIAQIYQVKASAVARIRSYQPMDRPPVVIQISPREAENTIRADSDYRKQAETASARLRDAVRLCVDRMSVRAGVAGPDWVGMDARGPVE